VFVYSPHGSAATPEYDSRQSTLDYSPSSAEDYDTWYIAYLYLLALLLRILLLLVLVVVTDPVSECTHLHLIFVYNG